MKYKIVVFTLLFTVLSSILLGQDDPFQKGNTTRPLTKWEKKFGEVKYGENIYRKGSNWFNFGFGPSYHIETGDVNQSIALTYYHRYKGVFFNAGWHFTSPQFISFKPLGIVRSMQLLNDIHAGAGLRFEDRWYHFGFFIGPSFATTWLPDELKPNKSDIRHQLGAHVELQLIFKYLYDLGIGVSAYGSFNKRYQVAGLQLTFYFSNAFVAKY